MRRHLQLGGAMLKLGTHVLTTAVAVALAPAAIAKGVAPRFDLPDPSGSPFPSDRLTTDQLKKVAK
jgi:hypothetical protein